MKTGRFYSSIFFLPILFASLLLSPVRQFESSNEDNPNYNIPMCRTGSSYLYYDFLVPPSDPIAPKLKGLGDLHFEVTTDSEQAQEFFNQGIKLVYAFNHAEAHRSFQEAVRLDPNFAMAYWGQALALGPNINDPFPDMERQKTAYEAIQKASSLKAGKTKMEQALIEAYESRCTKEEVEQQSLNEAYFKTMSAVYDRFPNHPDVGVLYASAIMNTMPWNYYDENKEPRINTAACVAALKKVIKEHPNHPGGHHYFIHIIEAFDPYDALPSADALGALMPSAGHIVHMPSHIYIGTDNYAKAAAVNRKAIKADEDYIAQCQAQGIYPLVYYPHNIHFLWAATTMLGNSDEAIEAAEKVADKSPIEMAEQLAFLQDFLSVPLQAYVRFGKWNDILTTPKPPANLLHVNMIWHYARGMAYANIGEIESARKELNNLSTILENEATQTLLAAYNNPTSEVGKVAYAALAGEIESETGNLEKALKYLEEAVELEDNLVYQEPKAWHAPTRHYYGAVLLETGKSKEAELVYRADLEDNKGNGWALFGLTESLMAQGKYKEAKESRTLFEKAWAEADVALTSTRF